MRLSYFLQTRQNSYKAAKEIVKCRVSVNLTVNLSLSSSEVLFSLDLSIEFLTSEEQQLII